MQIPEQEIFNISIVIIGSFNPRIFQPEWLVNKKLIRESEGDPENLKMVHADLTVIETDEFKLEIRPSRLELQTFQESYREPLKDLCASIFQLLSETPISAFGINYGKHFKMQSEKEYVNFGYHLAPINKTFDFIEDPRLLEIIITDQKPEKTKNTPTKNIKIFPSDLIPARGVAINVNSHYDDFFDGRSFSDFLSANWESILNNSENIIMEIWKKYN
ncbi:hypothetical protein B0A81_11465 [Flavobacterium plurextorum]|uniref:TIGR04255 family protein n=1 Tax=Flavobacterium plurextorum TaxID=1114867 RepID=A0ABX4CVG8_9FLAO|nr:hypothetical protein [Flavobacterium plurextorum]OXB07362.1 hypothetical protein B0A81_11465 [Flavobacterium plurextorum]